MKNNNKKQQKLHCIMRHPFILPPHTTRLAKKVSKMSHILSQIRRVHFIGETDNSCRMIIPRQIVNRVGIGKHEYLQVSLDENTNKIIIEKLEDSQRGIV